MKLNLLSTEYVLSHFNEKKNVFRNIFMQYTLKDAVAYINSHVVVLQAFSYY